jgi:hypothetical protein
MHGRGETPSGAEETTGETGDKIRILRTQKGGREETGWSQEGEKPRGQLGGGCNVWHRKPALEPVGSVLNSQRPAEGMSLDRDTRSSSFHRMGIRACRQLSQITLAARCTAARKLRAVLS